MRDIRASSAPMMDQCPASGMAQEGEITVGSTGRPAIVGSTVHAISRQIVEEHLTHVPDVEPYMIENGLESEVDHSELEMLSMFFLQSWREMKDKIANVVCEAEMKYPAGDIMITGHTDIKGVR